MTSRDFCYWLQGYFELSGTGGQPLMAGNQLEQVKAHLAMVFKHETDPSMGPPQKQEYLSQLHGDGGFGGSGSGSVLVRC